MIDRNIKVKLTEFYMVQYTLPAGGDQRDHWSSRLVQETFRTEDEANNFARNFSHQTVGSIEVFYIKHIKDWR
jgi:hypothetical protein